MEKVERNVEDFELLKVNINRYLEEEFGFKERNLFENRNIEQIAHTENEIGHELDVYIDIEDLEVVKSTSYENYYKEIEGFDTLKELAEWFEGIDFEFLTSLNR